MTHQEEVQFKTKNSCATIHGKKLIEEKKTEVFQ